MAVFACTRCRAALTPVLRFLAPQYDEREPTVAAGGFFVDPEPSAKRWDDDAEEWVPATSTGCFVVNPDDAVAVRWFDREGHWSGCCGPDGDPEGNLLCRSCGTAIGTLRADCWTALEVRLLPERVTRVADQEGAPREQHPAWFGELRGDPVTRAIDGPSNADVEDEDYDDEDDDDDEEEDEADFSAWHLAVGGGRLWVPADNAPLLVVIDSDALVMEAVVELPNAEAGLAKSPPRWFIPTVLYAADAVWITDVVDGGWFCVDPSTAKVTERVDSGDSASTPIARALAHSRAAGALAVEGANLWWSDGKDGRLRRANTDTSEVSVTPIDDGRSVYAAFGKIWATGSTNVIGSMGRLHRIEPTTGEVETTVRLFSEPESVAAADGSLWLLDASPSDYHDELIHRLHTKTIDCDDDDYENETLLTRLNPGTLSVERTTAIEGQVHDLVSDGVWMWAIVFSVRDQGHRVVRIDPATGLEDRRLSLDDIGVSQYNPAPTPPTPLASDDFNTRVRDVVAERLRRSDAELTVQDPRLDTTASGVELVIEVRDSLGANYTLRCALRPAGADDEPGDPERLAEIITTTHAALWRTRDTASARPDGLRALD